LRGLVDRRGGRRPERAMEPRRAGGGDGRAAPSRQGQRSAGQAGRGPRGRLMSYDIPIEAGKIREFARAVQSRATDHTGSAATIPPTFLTTAGMSWQPPAESPLAGIALDLRRVLHAEEEYRFHGRVPHAGETLTVTARIGDEW